MDTLTIRNAVPADAQQVYEINCIAFDLEPGTTSPEDGVLSAEAIMKHIERFSEGTFVAEYNNQVVGFALTMRVKRGPEEQPLKWLDAIGGYELANHAPDGEWLYGVDFGVHPDFRKHGIGTMLYRARFAMIERLNLRGFYAGGMLAGFPNYNGKMSLDEYGHKVMSGQIVDPTVSMQINRGFRPAGVIKDYCGTEGAMLIVWQNQAYMPRMKPQVAQEVARQH